jgi:hypothetical protein
MYRKSFLIFFCKSNIILIKSHDDPGCRYIFLQNNYPVHIIIKATFRIYDKYIIH